MTTPRARRHHLRRFWHYGVPAAAVGVVVVFLAVATHTQGGQSAQVAAQSQPTLVPEEEIPKAPLLLPTPRTFPTRTPLTNVVITSTKTPTVTLTPTPTAQPTSTGSVLTLDADRWTGGVYEESAFLYGRSWTAIYGAQSRYPRATLVLTLADDPTEPIVLTITGLDDDLPAKLLLTLEINAQRVYQGESWFANWDGVAVGQSVVWSTVEITIPPELLLQGKNRITIRSATQSANDDGAPFVLLSSVTVTSTEPNIFHVGRRPQVMIVTDVADGAPSTEASPANND